MATDQSMGFAGPQLRVAIVTQYFLPENTPIPSSVPGELSKRNFDVRVITAFPSYPTGRVFDGYRQRFSLTEMVRNVPVCRVPSVISHSNNALGRMMNYFSFGLSVLGSPRAFRDVDIVYVYATQMTAAIAPYLWSLWYKRPYVLHVQDLWPESITGSGMLPHKLSHLAERVLSPFLKAAYSRAAAVVGIAPTMTKLLVERGATSETSATVFNWGPEVGATAEYVPSSDLVRIAYAGTIGPLQNFEAVLEAVSQVRDRARFYVDVYGDGISLDDVTQRARDLGLENVRFHGRLPLADVVRRTSLADFQLVTLKDLPVFRMTIPSKFQSSLASGVPVITNVAGDLAEIVTSSGVGIVARAGDLGSLVTAIETAVGMSVEERLAMRDRVVSTYQSKFSKKVALDSLSEVLRGAARGRTPVELKDSSR